MSIKSNHRLANIMLTPSVAALLIWMIIPLTMTLWFSFQRYNLLSPGMESFAGFDNYVYFLTDPDIWQSLWNTLAMVLGVLTITVGGGVLLALLLDQPIWGQGVVRMLVITPFFIMPTVSALVWKNMFMNPVSGLFAFIAQYLGLEPFDFFSDAPLMSIILIVSWQWLPFATLILLTALQSLNHEQLEAAEIDGAPFSKKFYYLILPHLVRPITIVVLIQTIFHLSIFAEILVTTNGGPGTASTNLPFLVYSQSLLGYDVGAGSAGGVIAIILANIVAFMLVKMIGKNLEV